jgi:antirestriction protein ArdC
MNYDLYAEVTNRIITQLEQGVIPWKSPYFSKVGFPRNFASGNPYHGINVFLLGSLRYTSPFFLTFLQAKELGGHVKKGEKGFLVIKYGTYTKEAESAGGGQATEEHRKYLKGYTVFHASQIEGVAFPEPENTPELPASAACDRARAMVAGMPNAPKFAEGSAVPCYRRSADSVNMPERRFFTSEEAYYSTLFHELAHSTGHESRLARTSLLESKGIDAEGDARKTYAEEELVAEMGASFLCAHAGIIEAELENSAAYLQGWIDALKSKDAKGWIIRAASQAQKAADYILNAAEEVQP